MISNFTTEQLTKMLCEKLNTLGYKIILSNQVVDNAYSTIVVNTPLESVTKKYNIVVLQKTFQMTIECLADNKYNVMKMMDEVSQVLIQYNFTRINTLPDTIDEVSKKYKLSTTFEVKYNGLTNSFV